MKPQWKEVPRSVVDPQDFSEEAQVGDAYAAARWAAGESGVVIGPLTETTDRIGGDLSVAVGKNLTPSRTWVAAGSVPGNPTPFKRLSVGLCGGTAYWDLQSWDDSEWATGVTLMPPPPV